MTVCELCGAVIEKGIVSCPRCGFDFPKTVRSDSRDKKILAGHEGEKVEDVKRGLRDKLTYLTSYFEHLDADDSLTEDIPSFLEEVLGLLHIPLTIGMGDEIKFNEREHHLITVVVSKLENADIQTGDPVASTRSYIRS